MALRIARRIARRDFFRGTAAAAGASALFSGLFARRASAGGYGDLVPDPEGVLDLPAGFSYSILETAGAEMNDGYVVPGRPDGMACFEGPGETWVLMRNHEVGTQPLQGAYGASEVPAAAYDAATFGGVTRVVIDASTGARISSNLVLTGTARNCAGGPSPWGWLSCEEDVSPGHGYVFVCPTDAASVAAPQRVPGFGRFNHEAAAVDPDTLVTYLTEDRGDGCLYRHVPADASDPFVGQLQALRVVGDDAARTTSMGTVGETVDVDWVDVTDPDPAADTVRVAARGDGAAVFSRGEGIWYADGAVYFSCTNGGPAGLGQVFRLLDGPNGGSLELVAVAEDRARLQFPDNLAMAPWGELFIAEDGGPTNAIRILGPDGDIRDFARNALSDSEFAGVCFSPDGAAMFVNIQSDGLTLMVTGPFPVDDGGEDEGGTDADSAGMSTSDGTGDSGGASTEGRPEASTDGSAADDGGMSGGCHVGAGGGAGLAIAAVAAGARAATAKTAASSGSSPDRNEAEPGPGASGRSC